MPRRKLTNGQHAVSDDSSDSSDSEKISSKRTRLDEVEDTTIALSDNKQNVRNQFDNNPLHSTLSLSARINTYYPEIEGFDEDLQYNEGGSHCDGFQSFMRSFQFFSDEESDSEQEMKNNILPSFNTSISTSENADEEKKNPLLQNQLHSKNCSIIQCPLKCLEVLFLDHPTSVPIVGYLRVTLLAGKASIQGYNLKKDNPVVVFSQRQTGILSVTTTYSEEEDLFSSGPTDVANKIKKKLSTFELQEIKAYVKLNMKFSSTIVCLEELVLPPNLEFLGLYFSSAISFKSKDDIMRSSRLTAFHEDNVHCLDFGSEYEEIFTSMHKHLCKLNRRKPGQARDTTRVDADDSDDNNSEEPDSPKVTGFRILVYGPKKSGKSTMLRYLINSFLNKYSEVYYLDTDCGQTEFTPPGVISLVKITKPVFGPPYSHLRKPLKTTFIGSITVETSPPMYLQTVEKMIKYFNANFPDNILLVNTLGWLTGLGQMVLESTRKCLVPAVEIELSKQLSKLQINLEGRVLKCSVGFERTPESATKKGDNRPSDLRDFALLSYLGDCQDYFKQPTYVTKMRPVMVCWEDVAIFNFHKRLPRNRWYEALNGAIVALCHVDPKMILTVRGIPEYPKTLPADPDNECLGFGLVRSVDEENRLLHIVTPMGLDTLLHVNAIMSGNIILPRPLLFDQGIEGVEFYYTDESKGDNDTRKKIRNRARQHRSSFNSTI